MSLTPAQQLARVRLLLELSEEEAAAFLVSSPEERAEGLAALVDAGKLPRDTLADVVEVLRVIGVLVAAVIPAAGAAQAVIAVVKAARS